MDTYSPAAIEKAPPISPAMPARRTGTGRRVGAGHAEDQRDVGHQAVADPEHGGPGPAAADVPVLVLLVHADDRTDPAPVRTHCAPVVGAASPSGRPPGGRARPGAPLQSGPWQPPCTASKRSRTSSGQHLGYCEWHVVDQAQVNLFADATGDHQWIHVDPEAGQDGPFGGPIAHGYLTLSLAPVLLGEVLHVEGISMGVNYGCNKVRFPSPVMVGSKLRLGVAVAEVEDVTGGVQVVLDLTLETEGSSKPSCVAQVVYRYYA